MRSASSRLCSKCAVNALDLLTADHNRVRGLFRRFQSAVDEEAFDTASGLADEIFRELEVHTSIEEEIFYSRVGALGEEIAEIVDEGIEEHHVVEVLMEEISALTPGHDQWKAKMTVLIENVEHHADEEETELFVDEVAEVADAA